MSATGYYQVKDQDDLATDRYPLTRKGITDAYKGVAQWAESGPVELRKYAADGTFTTLRKFPKTPREYKGRVGFSPSKMEA